MNKTRITKEIQIHTEIQNRSGNILKYHVRRLSARKPIPFQIPKYFNIKYWIIKKDMIEHM